MTEMVETTGYDVAQCFLALGKRDGIDIDRRKLQCLLYHAQGCSMVETGKPLFKEPIEAWKF